MPRREKKQDVYRGPIIKSQSSGVGEIVAFSEVVYTESEIHNPAETGHPEDKIGNETFSHGDSANWTDYRLIAGFIKNVRNDGKVTAISKVTYGKESGGGPIVRESGTSECEGGVQGLLGRGRTTVPTEFTTSVEHPQVNTSLPQPKN